MSGIPVPAGSVAEQIGVTLAGLGVGHLFGVVGSGNFALTNALRDAGVPYTAARHEGGAAAMADGYSRLAQLPAVLTTHQGCGLTNAVTGIAEAAKSRTPMLVLTADSAGDAVLSNFRIDQDALARSVGAVPERVHSPDSAIADVVRAYRTAVHGRRTVVLSVPLDVQAAQVPATSVVAPAPPGPVRPDAGAIEALAELVRSARRPVFVAGRGARGAGPELADLAAHAGALVATSAVANGLFETDEFTLGISGGFSSPLAAELIGEADLIVGWGCALNMWTMRHGALIGSATTVAQVDDDQAALGRHRPVDLGVLGDCAATARDLRAALAPDGGVRYRTDEVRGRLAGQRWWNQTPTDDLSTTGPEARIDPRVLTRELDALLPLERVVAVDSGNFMGYPSAYLRVPDEHGFCFTQAFQSIGLGLGSGLGAALARPDRLGVVATGDGGLLMAVSELDTAVRLGRPLVIVVYDDAAYGAEVHHFTDGDHGGVVFPDTDLAALARGHGARGVTVRIVDDLSPVRDWLSDPDGVLLIDAKIASDGGAWWLAEAFRGH